MRTKEFMEDLSRCVLCEHRCEANRLEGETGVCRITAPVVASARLHPAPPESFTVFMAGCNYKCLNCQNWTIAQYPDNGFTQRGYRNPEELAEECLNHLGSIPAALMGADRIFFSGGEPTIHLPYIERVVEEARKVRPDTRVNVDTNGYLTERSLERVLSFATSITYDIKAYHDEVHLALTGTPSGPVLRNAAYIGRYARNRLWEYRILVIPGINEKDIQPLAEFIADINPSLPVCFLAFRPNFVLETHSGATETLMDRCREIAMDAGLKNASWAGHTGIPGKMRRVAREMEGSYERQGARMSGSYARHAGCHTHPRDCKTCQSNQACPIKTYIPEVST